MLSAEARGWAAQQVCNCQILPGRDPNATISFRSSSRMPLEGAEMALGSQTRPQITRGLIFGLGSFSGILEENRKLLSSSYIPPLREVMGSHMTGGTVMPITAKARINSRRTTATVASRNCFRLSSASLRMGWR